MDIKTNLPLELSSLVGRDDELAALGISIREQRLVTLTGPGGTGKTRLAKKMSRASVESFDQGAWFIDLSGVYQDAGVSGAVSRVLGVLEEAQNPLSQTIARQLGSRHILLVLDNCEQVLPGCAEFAEAILSQAPNAKVLATSREPLHIDGEFVYQVPPLDVENGVELFLQRAKQAGCTIANNNLSTNVVKKIVEKLDGVPLAIELAAARTPIMEPNQILDGLDRRFDLLTGGSRDATVQNKSLWASIAWSYDLMEPQEQGFARRLCVLRGFTLESATAISANGNSPGGTSLDLLQRLVDMSLLQVDRSGKEPRFRFLESVREFLLEKLLTGDEDIAARTAHLNHFIDFAEYRAERIILGEGPELMTQIQTEFDNLEDALVFSGNHENPGLMLRLLTALTGYYEIWGQHQHGMRWFDKALSRPGASDLLTARALWGQSHVSAYGGRMDIAYPSAMRALELAREIGDPWTESRALDIIGFAQSVSDPAAAYESLSRCIELGGKLNDSWAETHGIKMITAVYLFSHEIAGGSLAIENLLAVADKHDSRYLRAWGNAVKGYFARNGGDFEAAHDALAVSVENAGFVGDPATGGFAKVWTAALKADRGQVDDSRQEILGMMQTATATGTFLAVPEAMFQLGMIEVSAGNPEASLELIGDHVEGLKSAGIPVWAAQLALASAAALIALKRFDEAKALLDDARSMSASLSNALIDGLNLYLRGRLALARDDAGEAEVYLHEALEIHRDSALLPGLLRTIESVAVILIKKAKFEDAVRVLAFVDQSRNEMCFVRGITEAAEFQALMQKLNQKLGTETTKNLRHAAASSDLDEIIGLISRMRGKRSRASIGWKSLTKTERRVVGLVIEGLSNPQIAERMFIARGTVKVHLSHIFSKLEVTSRTQLASRAVAENFGSE